MKRINPRTAIFISFFFVLLFCYASTSKLLEFEAFQVQLAQSPLLSAYAGFTSYAIIMIEIGTSLLLCFPKTRLLGLYSSLALMCGFTIYIYLILYYSEFIPCSCGGILEKLGWTEHLFFNMACVVVVVIGILVHESSRPIRLIKSGLRVGITAVLSVLLVIILFVTSEHIIKKENNFIRRFLLHPVVEDRSLDLGMNSYYFAGVTHSDIYLGNVTAPLILTTVDTTLKRINAVRLSLDKSDYRFRNLQLQVRDSSYYLYDGSVPVIYRGTLGDTMARTISYQDAYFTQLTVLDSSSFAIRTQCSKSRQYLLAKLNLGLHPKLQMQPSILEKQIDGVFDSDGKLITGRNNSLLLYTYTYRNQFVTMNGNLDVLERFHTIDTTTVAKIQTRRLSDGTHKMSAPPLKVNGTIATNRNLLFIQSNLKGKHESREMWKRATVVDIYRTDQPEYVGSFYIEKEGDTMLSQMMADDQYLYVLIANKLKRYRFREPISKYFN